MLVGTAGNVAAQPVAVRADRLYTMAGQGVIEDGVVLIENGVIGAVGPASSVTIPAGVTVIRTLVATPGFVDAHAQVGLAGAYNVPADQDMDENTDVNTAQLRAIDGFKADELLVRYVLAHGVTTVHVGPGPSNPIAGQSGVFKTHASTVDEALMKFPVAMMFNLGETPKYGDGAPKTRMATAAIIRKALLGAEQYRDKLSKAEDGEEPDRDLQKEALVAALRGEVLSVFTCHRSDDIMTALRLAREFNLSLVLDGATEAYLVRDRIREAGVPVLVAPTMQRTSAIEKLNGTFENAAFLQRTGIPIAIQSGLVGYVPKTRVAPFEAGVAWANGLAEQDALEAITIGAARILGIDDRVGSLEAGKDADIVLLDGPPLEYLTHVTHVFVNGAVVYERE